MTQWESLKVRITLWIKDVSSEEPKSIDNLKVGDVVYYKGEYDDCHDVPYVVRKTWSDAWGRTNMWFDLEMEKPMSHDEAIEHWREYGKNPYREIFSVPWNEIEFRD